MSETAPSQTPPPHAAPVTASKKAPLAGVIGGVALSIALAGWISVRIVSAKAKQEQIAQQRSADDKRSAALAKAPPKVKVVTPVAQTWEPVVELDGTLAAGQSAELGFKIGGKLAKVGVKLGDNVKSGALLGVLDSSETGA